MVPNAIAATVQIRTPEQSPQLRAGERGVIIAVPSEFAESGSIYVAFVIRGDTVSTHLIDQAAISFAAFNREFDRLREYQIAIQKAANAA